MFLRSSHHKSNICRVESFPDDRVPRYSHLRSLGPLSGVKGLKRSRHVLNTIGTHPYTHTGPRHTTLYHSHSAEWPYSDAVPSGRIHCLPRRGLPVSKFDNPSRKARTARPGLSLFQLAALAAAISALGRHVMRTCAPALEGITCLPLFGSGQTQGERARAGVKPNRVLRLRGCFPNSWEPLVFNDSSPPARAVSLDCLHRGEVEDRPNAPGGMRPASRLRTASPWAHPMT